MFISFVLDYLHKGHIAVINSQQMRALASINKKQNYGSLYKTLYLEIVSPKNHLEQSYTIWNDVILKRLQRGGQLFWIRIFWRIALVIAAIYVCLHPFWKNCKILTYTIYMSTCTHTVTYTLYIHTLLPYSIPSEAVTHCFVAEVHTINLLSRVFLD